MQVVLENGRNKSGLDASEVNVLFVAMVRLFLFSQFACVVKDRNEHFI